VTELWTQPTISKLWFVAILETDIPWPMEETSVDFVGHKLLLRPVEEDCAPDIAFQISRPMTRAGAESIVSRYLSGLAWVEKRSARIKFIHCSTSLMRGGKGPDGPPIDADCYVRPSPAPTDPKAQLALALYREAISVNSIPYQFLGLFKIINILHKKGFDQVIWINKALPVLVDRIAKKRLSELQAQGVMDVGKYLYESGRCAVAHAYSQPSMNPDETEHLFRMSSDMPLMCALAEHAIENDIGIARR